MGIVCETSKAVVAEHLRKSATSDWGARHTATTQTFVRICFLYRYYVSKVIKTGWRKHGKLLLTDLSIDYNPAAHGHHLSETNTLADRMRVTSQPSPHCCSFPPVLLLYGSRCAFGVNGRIGKNRVHFLCTARNIRVE